MDMETQTLFLKKQELLYFDVNSAIKAHNETLEEGEPISLLEIPNDPSCIKIFMAKTIVLINYFHKQSTKTFAKGGCELYDSIACIWKSLKDEQKLTIWTRLFEMFVLSVELFPIVKKNDYPYVNVVLTLREWETDIPMPKVSVLQMMSGLVKGCYERINQEVEEKKIDKDGIEKLFSSLKTDDIKTIQQAQNMRPQIKKMMEDEKVQYVIELIKLYFTDNVVEYLGNECKKVFDSPTFKKFKKKHNKELVIDLIRTQKLTFAYVRQMIYDSGVIELLGDNFEFPTNFEELKSMIEKYTGKSFEENDMKGFLENNMHELIDHPMVKKMLKKSGFSDMMGPFLDMFKKKDHKEETEKRRMKRRKKKLRKMMKED